MLSKNKIKLIRSLDQKKNRLAHGLFVAEGKKMVLDLIRSGFFPEEIFATVELVNELKDIGKELISLAGKNELEKISFLKSTPDIIALFRIPERNLDWNEIINSFSLLLDSVQDPGNLGTIIRTADWFGIKNLICSEDTVDLYNPKTIQSTMGAFARVKVHYLPLNNFLAEAKIQQIPILGAFMEGENLYKTDLPLNGIVVLGNEGSGISKETEQFISRRISIPTYPVSGSGSESLNVAVAASIICAEFRRRVMIKDLSSQKRH